MKKIEWLGIYTINERGEITWSSEMPYSELYFNGWTDLDGQSVMNQTEVEKWVFVYV